MGWLDTTAQVGTTAAAAIGVIAFVNQVRGRSARVRQARIQQARGVWVTEPTVDLAHVIGDEPGGTRPEIQTQIVVWNKSDQVVTDVVVTAQARYVSPDGEPWKSYEQQDKTGRIGPNQNWETHFAVTPLERATVDTTGWTWVADVTFFDSAGLAWQRDTWHRLSEGPDLHGQERPLEEPLVPGLRRVARWVSIAALRERASISNQMRKHEGVSRRQWLKERLWDVRYFPD
jgi:hypothetical protein